MQRPSRAGLAALGLIALSASVIVGQRDDVFIESRDHPAIQYSTRPTDDAVLRLNRLIEQNQIHLAFEPSTGYLRSALGALDIPVESQTLVFSETSFQPERISMANPRAIFFNDTISVGWINGNDLLEVAVEDPQQGVVFYTLNQKPVDKPQFMRREECLLCHLSSTTLGVPGPLVESMLPMTDDPNEFAVGWPVDHRTPVRDRWGGWYVTGTRVPSPHLGNVPVYHVPRAQVRAAVAPKLVAVAPNVKREAYLTPYSDVVALMVLNHQVTMTNLLTRLNWETRLEEYKQAHKVPAAATIERITPAANQLVDYLLFIDEAPLTGAVEGSAGFAEKFAALGPRDHLDRSLRQFDLHRRLMRYPCSYMIYSEAFDALPAKARTAVYERMWQILSGKEQGKAYSKLSLADRRAVVEILRETKKDLPAYFEPVAR
jgi:hypothetical protein